MAKAPPITVALNVDAFRDLAELIEKHARAFRADLEAKFPPAEAAKPPDGAGQDGER
jgi:hypothetical protein